MSLLEIQSLSVRYGKRLILNEVDLSVQKGEVMALIGPNGAGKTTLMRAISGVIPLDAGRIRIAGVEVSGLSPARLARLMAVVPQARQMPEAYTVRETVMFGRTPYLNFLGQPSKKDLERVEWAMQRTGIVDFSDRLLGELSGGEQQRVLLARALAQDTPVLLLDEPTTYLDLHHQSMVLKLAREFAHQQGLAVLMALHDLNLVSLFADRAAMLVNGKVLAMGMPDEVLKPDLLQAAYDVPVSVIRHPEYGTPLILPDGYRT